MTVVYTCVRPRRRGDRRGLRYVALGDSVRLEWPEGVAWVRVVHALECVSAEVAQIGIVVGRTTLGRWVFARVGDGERVQITDHRRETDETVRASALRSMVAEWPSVRWPERTEWPVRVT